MADHLKVRMFDRHFVLERNKKSGPDISFITGSMLSMGSKALLNKGIKVPGEETFNYNQQQHCGVYIFEAGLAPTQAEYAKDPIYVHVTCNKKRFLLGTLSSKQPRIQLNLFMNQDFSLTHTSKRRVVLFNAYLFSPLPLSECRFNTNKKFWVTEVEPLKDNTIHPRADEKKYHILRVFAAASINDNIDVHVRFLDKSEKIGTLSSTEASLSCNLAYDEDFTLSHTSTTTNVLVSGYTVPDIPLKELPGHVFDEIDTKEDRFDLIPPVKSRFDLMPPVKRSADPEYTAFVKSRGDAAPQVPKLTDVSVVAAPLVSFF